MAGIDGGTTPSADAPAPSETQVSTPAPVAPSPSETSTPTPSSDATAQSSGADSKGTETKEDLLSAVLKVVKPDPDADRVILPGQEPTPGSKEPQPETAGTDANASEELSEDPSPEELARYHSRTRRRMDKLLEQRNSARAELENAKAEAQTAGELRRFLQANDIQKDDFGVLLDLGVALRKGDMATFYQGVKPYMDLAEEALGLRVPDDLAQRVHQGHMTTEQARLFAQERMARQLAEGRARDAAQRVDQSAQQAYQVQAQQAQQALQGAVQSAVTAWEARVRQSDPDYGHKQDAVKNLLWAVVQEKGPPQSPEQAVEIANEAYRRANDMVSRFSPRPRATSAVPSSVNRNNGATPEPKTLMEAAVLGLSRSHRNA